MMPVADKHSTRRELPRGDRTGPQSDSNRSAMHSSIDKTPCRNIPNNDWFFETDYEPKIGCFGPERTPFSDRQYHGYGHQDD